MCVMKQLLAGLVVSIVGMAFVAPRAEAGIIYRVSQISPAGTITIPETATFAVTIQSDTGNQVVTGVDFTVALSDSAGKGGIITGGSNSLFAQGGFFATDFPGFVADYSTFNATGATMSATPTQIATFTLATGGSEVIPGTYSISLSGLLALDGGFNEISPVSAVPVTYTLAAVPEPSTFVMAGLACGGVGLLRWKRMRGRRVGGGESTTQAT